MDKKIEVAVYMPDEEALQFLLFKKHYSKIAVLIKANVFEQKNATISLNFDSVGDLKSINRSDSLYSARHNP